MHAELMHLINQPLVQRTSKVLFLIQVIQNHTPAGHGALLLTVADG